jgi:Zn-dependent metalloprotease
VNCIVPPYIFEKMMESPDKAVRDAGLESLLQSAQVRGERLAMAEMGFAAVSAPADGRRTIFDCQNSFVLSTAVVARSEDGAESNDDSVNRLFDGLGTTRQFLSDVFERNSIDNRGARLDGYVHFGVRHNNASWDGSVMRFGDGDGVQFTDFTLSLGVIAHELGHAVTQYTSDLIYDYQSGALNESFSDVFGSMVKQWQLNQTVEDADWLIGEDAWTPGKDGDALRSLKAPGKAYVNHPLFGTDPQPDHMNKFLNMTRDNRGVHYNSGIPNKAFYEAAMLIGGQSWDVSGQIWYKALQESPNNASFQQFAMRTYEAAEPWGSQVARSVAEGWRAVGITIAGAGPAALRGRRVPDEVPAASLNDILRQLSQINKRLEALEESRPPQRRRRG